MNALEKFISSLFPKKALERAAAKFTAESIYNPTSRSKQTANYHPHYPLDANQHMSFSLQAGQNKAKGLYSETAIAGGIINAIVDGAIGSGLIVESAIKRSVVGIDEKEASRIQKIIEDRWELWCEDARACDHYEKSTFGIIQRTASISALIEGDVLLHIGIGKYGNVFIPKVQIISGSAVQNQSGTSDTKTIAGGVEVDSQGRTVAYHVMQVDDSLSPSATKRVLKYGDKTKRLQYSLVTLNEIQAGQRRGRSVLLRVQDQIIQLNRYSEAETVKAIIQSYMTIFIEKALEQTDQFPGNGLTEQLKASAFGPKLVDKKGNEIELDASSERQVTLAPGAIIELNPGEKASLPESKAPVSQFWQFMEAQLKIIGMGVGIPYEVLIKSFNASYSASQAAIQDAARGWAIYRKEWSVKFCQPIYETFVETLVLQGIISCPGFFDDEFKRKAWCSANWYGPAILHVDPRKSVLASIEAIDNHLSTREIETRKLNGLDWNAVIARNAEEAKIIQEYFGQFVVTEKTFEPMEDEE